MEAIKKLYARRIFDGFMTIEEVPPVVKEDVQAYLDIMIEKGHVIF